MSKYMYDMQIRIFEGDIQYRKLYREGSLLEEKWSEWEKAYEDHAASIEKKSDIEVIIAQCISTLEQLAYKQNTYHKERALLEGVEALRKLLPAL